MKNTIQIDLDTNREHTVILTKPENLVPDIDNFESAKKMVLTDITTLCNGLGTLIQLGNDSNYFNSEELAKLCVGYLQDNFLNTTSDEEG